MSFNLWDHKPWWCQPWSIILTGITIISGSWWLLNNIFLTIILSILIFIWWFYFLYLYPRLIAHTIKTDDNFIKNTK